MPQPPFSKRSRSRWNAAMAGEVGSKKALARRLDVDPATITRALQPEHCPGAISMSAEVLAEMQAMLCALGRGDVLEDEVNARLSDDGYHVRLLVDVDDDDRQPAHPLDVMDKAIETLNAARQLLDDTGRRPCPRKLKQVRRAYDAMGAVLRRLERTGE